MGYSSNDPRNYLAMARQTAIGTEASSGFKFLRFLGDSGIDIGIESESIYTGGDGQDHGLHYRSKTNPDGNVETFSWPDAFTFLSAWAMGSAAAVGTSVGIGTSIFTPNATVPALTVEQAWGGGNQIHRVSDAILGGLTIAAEAGQPWRVSAPIIGGGTPYYRDGAASALSATLETGDPAMYAGGAYLLNGATELDLRSWSFNFERNIDDDLRTTNTFRRKVIPLTRSLTIEGEMIWQDQALWKRAQFGSGSVVPHTLATGSFHAERILTASQMLAVDVPFMNFTDVSVNGLQPDGETVLLSFTAMAVKAGTGICQIRSTHNNIGASAYIG